MHNVADLPEFKKIQYEFAAHIRNPAENPKPSEVEARRMKIYNELFYNNVEGFMSNSFPVLREICGEEKWHRLIRQYFSTHQSSTPLFPEMPREFLRYLEEEREAESDDYPFMLELAHYEWVELALSISEQEADLDKIDADGDLYEGVPVLSPNAWALSYSYPVHQIGPDFLPEQPGEQPTFLVVYRTPEFDIKFMEINAVTAHLMELMSSDKPMTGQQMIGELVLQLNHPDPDIVIKGGIQVLNDLKQRNIILGVNKS